MNKLFSLSLLLAVVATACASTSTGDFSDPKHPGKCVVGGAVLAPGEHKDPNSPCGRILCSSNGWADFQDCGVVHVDGCTLGDFADKSLNYPECCKRKLVCPDNKELDGTLV